MTTPAKRQKLQLPKKSWKEDESGRTCQDDDEQTAKNADMGAEQCLENWFAPLRAASKQRASFAEARWDAEAQLAIVTVRKGAALNTIGKTYQSQLALHVEEAVWLVDKGALLLRNVDHCSLRTQECYALLDSTSFPLSRFLAYAHLKRAGYIPLRHDLKRWRSDPAQPHLPEQDLSSSKLSFQPRGSPRPKLRYAPYFPLISPPESDCEAVQPSRNWWPREQACLLDAPAVLSVARASSCSFPSCSSSSGVISRLFLSQSTTASCLKALQAIGPTCSGALEASSSPGDSSHTGSSAYELHYDVYRARKGFKMSSPGPPDFCLAVYSFDEKMPSMTNIHKLLAQAHGVPVRVCIDSSGTLSFLRVSAMTEEQLDVL